jgi:multiple sugar transport system permease protein
MIECQTTQQARGTGQPTWRDRYYRFVQGHQGWIYVAPAMLLLIMVVVYPVIYSTFIGFFDKSLVRADAPFIGLANYKDVILDPLFHQALRNTLLYMAVSISASFVIGFGLALLMRRITWGRSFFRIALIAPMAMAPLVVGLTWRWMYNPLFGLINWFFEGVGLPQQAWLASAGTAMFALLVVDIWEWSPLVFLILYAGLSGLPREPYEAAELDGASVWMVFRRITLPLLKPVLLVALLLRTVDAFRTFDIAYVLTEGGPGYATELLSLYVYRQGFYFNNTSRAAAAAMLMVVGMSIIAAFYFRFLYAEVE